MKREDLEKAGLTAEALEKAGLGADVLDKIFALHGKGIEAQKAKAEGALAEVEALKTQLAEASEKIEGFKKLDPDAIQKAADEWKAKADEYKAAAEKAATEAADKVAQLQFDHALNAALTEAKAKNPKAVKALLNTGDLKLADDGSIVGLKEQLEKVQVDNDFLFSNPENADPEIILGGKNPKNITGDPMLQAARAAANIAPPQGDK